MDEIDQDLINTYNEQKRAEAEKAQDQLLDVTLAKGIKNQVEASSKETQQAFVTALGVLAKLIRENEPSVTVKNQPEFPDSISTPDVGEVTKAIKTLTEAVNKKETDFSAVTKGLESLNKAVQSLPKPNDKISVTNQIDYSKSFKELKGAVEGIEISPTVNVPEPKVTVNNDFKEVLKELTDLQKAVKGIKIPEVPKTDLKPLIEATKKVSNTIANLSFPVPNYILPFKDVNGKAVQVQLDSSGNIPTSGGAAGGGLTDAELRATPVPVSGTVTVNEPVTVDAADLDIRSLAFATDKVDASGSGVGITEGGQTAEVNARADGKIALEVADDMTSFESFTQALSGSTDTTITFSQTVRLIKVKNFSTSSVVYVRDGAISSDSPANAENMGVAPTTNVPATEWYPFVGTTIHLRSAGTPTCSITGFY